MPDVGTMTEPRKLVPASPKTIKAAKQDAKNNLASSMNERLSQNHYLSDDGDSYDFSLLILGGFATALGIGAVAIALTMLSGLASVVTAGAGLFSIFCGISLFSVSRPYHPIESVDVDNVAKPGAV